MTIDWAALAEVFGVSLVVTVGLVGVFTLGVVGTSRRRTDEDPTTAASTAPRGLARAGGYLCFALCAAVVGYGILLIVG